MIFPVTFFDCTTEETSIQPEPLGLEKNRRDASVDTSTDKDFFNKIAAILRPQLRWPYALITCFSKCASLSDTLVVNFRLMTNLPKGEVSAHCNAEGKNTRHAGRQTLVCACGFSALIGYALPADAQQLDAASQLTGPDAVGNRLEADEVDNDGILDVDLQSGKDAWKADLKERTGLDFGMDYNILGFVARDAPDEDTSVAGAFRVFGTWELSNRGSPNNGSLVFKLEHRHGFTDVPPTEFGFNTGAASLTSSVFSDQGWRMTHLYWQQRFSGGRGVAYVGFLDVTDYVDVYALASPWTGFSNLAFQTGGGAIGGLPDGALGAMAGGFLTDNFYAVGGIADANGDATDLLGGFDSFFGDFETFKSFELGWTTSQEELFLNNAHVTLWQIDERTASGAPDGWGVNFSLSGSTENGFLPFLRGGWSEDAGLLYDASVSTGFGYTQNPGKSMLGVGLNWNRPNKTSFGSGLDDQYIAEVFQQLQLTENIELTPSIQYIKNPTFDPSASSSLLFGLRARVVF